jgi:hypothetical protein
MFQYQDRLPAGKEILTISNRWKNTQQWVLCPQEQVYAVVITK